MSLQKGGPRSAGTNTALPTGVQAGGRQALPLLREIHPEDGRGAWHSQRVHEEVDPPARGRRGRARRAQHRRTRGVGQAQEGEPRPQTGEGGLAKSRGLLRQGRRDSVSLFRFVEAERAHLPVALLCRMLGVSRSGYYDWKGRPPSKRSTADAALTETIREIHERS